MRLFGKKDISRRGFLGLGAATAGAAAAATALSGCSSGGAEVKETTGEPQVVKDESQITDALEEYSSTDCDLTASATWTLPVGTVLFYSEGDWSAAMMAPETAKVPNTIGVLSLTSGELLTLCERPTKGDGYEFFDVRVGAGVFCWVEINYSTKAWTLYAQSFASGQLSGDPTELDHGNSDWEPAMFSPYGSGVIWQKMPSTYGNKTTKSSHCYLWAMADGSKTNLYTSPGRFATHPRVSNDILTISPRVHADEGTYYGMTALDLANSNKQIDQLVLPASVRPFEATYIDETFAFAIEATYSDSGKLGNLGYYLGREGGPFIYIGREPAAGVCGGGTHICMKTRSSTCVLNLEAMSYSVVTCPDRSLDYGDYPASEGQTNTLVTYATVKDAQGIPEAVCARVFPLKG